MPETRLIPVFTACGRELTEQVVTELLKQVKNIEEIKIELEMEPLRDVVLRKHITLTIG